MKMRALKELEIMLRQKGIPHEVIERSEYDGGQICAPDYEAFHEGRGVSVIQHNMSMGAKQDKLEFRRKDARSPVGFLSPAETCELVEKAMADMGYGDDGR